MMMMASSQHSQPTGGAGVDHSPGFVDDWLTIDAGGNKRACRSCDELHACETFVEAHECMKKAAETIQQTTRSWSVKTGREVELMGR